MDWNEHYVGFLVMERLAEARAEAARRALVPRRADRRLRQRLGTALIRFGHRLAGDGAGLADVPCEDAARG